MNLILEFNSSPNYLYVKVSGKLTTTYALKGIDSLKTEADKKGVKTIFLDLFDLLMPDNELTRFYSGEKIANTFKNEYAIAAYIQPEKINGFAEIIAQKKGGKFKVFDSKNEAIGWLLDNATSSACVPQTEIADNKSGA